MAMNPKAPVTPPAHGRMLDQLSKVHAATKSRYDKLSTLNDQTNLISSELSQLMEMGDMVEPGDVTEAAARIVAAGVDAKQMAGVLSSMPSGSSGDALAAWVAQSSQELMQKQEQLQPALAEARHDMGVAGLQMVAGHSIQQQAPQFQPPQPGAMPGPQAPSLSGAPAQAPAAQLNETALMSMPKDRMPEPVGNKLMLGGVA